MAAMALANATPITTYVDRGTFLSAVSPVTNIRFTDALVPPGSLTTDYSTSAGLTLSGVNFTGIAGNKYYEIAVSSSYCCAAHNRGDHINGPGLPEGADPHTVITLPGNTYAAGVDLFAVILGDGAGDITDVLKVTVGGNTYNVATKKKSDGTGKVFFGIKPAR